ncbi:MAG TPA: glutamate formimidoyltransferase [Patescibacteria group bacterium]|nr:glutamate formimidoyltransferase [Patescibacteria group bacterium]
MDKIIECVPNFSEGRNQEIIQAIANAARDKEKVRVLDVEWDKDHNRSLATIVGEPEAVLVAVWEMIKKATELIDMEKHQGEHPRIGAIDVVPFIPVANVSMEECVELAKRLGKRVGEELKIPVYLYEAAASRPERVNLANVRQGDYEDLKKEITSNPERKPDFGPSQMHPTAGAMVIGARKFLIAYNINLDTQDVEIAKEIARLIREKDGGFPAVKALGFAIKDKGFVQVSINLCDFEKTNMDVVFRKVKEEVGKRGIKVFGSEIYGMVPKAALEGIDLAELQLIDFKEDQILENKLKE